MRRSADAFAARETLACTGGGGGVDAVRCARDDAEARRIKVMVKRVCRSGCRS